ncbi:hypothetical protein U8D42_29120 (plasmid) [Mycobacterium europaeum]|uniref:hypothetical protein n=1 Tax=Mycobacterium TaxID=1763 RepID=UPI002AE017A4|nr:hypothetical protein [Mycobacterium europaeum]MEA1163125.1 hypothetical protein [Mycobacterium europaeum]
MTTTRKPAITRTHPADVLPDRPTAAGHPEPSKHTSTTAARSNTVGERLTEQHNVRIRPSVKDRLSKAVDKLRYETGDRSISIAYITDQAIDTYLRERGC